METKASDNFLISSLMKVCKSYAMTMHIGVVANLEYLDWILSIYGIPGFVSYHIWILVLVNISGIPLGWVTVGIRNSGLLRL